MKDLFAAGITPVEYILSVNIVHANCSESQSLKIF